MMTDERTVIHGLPPRMMSDAELRAFFGLSERALRTLRFDKSFPRKDSLIGKTDRKAVDSYFDRRSNLQHPSSVDNVVDGREEF
jgi:hypothetical protein